MTADQERMTTLPLPAEINRCQAMGKQTREWRDRLDHNAIDDAVQHIIQLNPDMDS